MNDPYRTVESARHALQDLLEEVDALTATLALIYRAWTEMDPNDRRELAQQHPRLIRALLIVEREQFARVQAQAESVLIDHRLGSGAQK